MLHHTLHNVEEAPGMTPCVSLEFISQMTRKPPGAKFPVAKMFMNNVPNGASKKIKIPTELYSHDCLLAMLYVYPEQDQQV